MGRRWKRRQQELLDEENDNMNKDPKAMIEHSIMPYPPKQQSYYQNPTFQKKQMLHEDYVKYLLEAAERGYKIGVVVKTNYGAPARITGIKPGNPHIDIWGDKTIPDCFLISRIDSGIQQSTGYNEQELEIINQ